LSDVPLADELGAYRPGSDAEAADVARLRALVAAGDPWSRDQPLHVTGSALIVHPPSRRVLLRWHQRMGAWLQVGGHGDPGEASALAVARREAREETALGDLRPWPDPGPPAPLLHVVIVPVPAGKGEPAHEHGDVRFVLATDRPDDAAPESPEARLRWLTLDEARTAAAMDNLVVTLDRLEPLLAAAG
jgi:8-oxo-dGTP pyrophosphatase MutT (NUDIX family)